MFNKKTSRNPELNQGPVEIYAFTLPLYSQLLYQLSYFWKNSLLYPENSVHTYRTRGACAAELKPCKMQHMEIIQK